MSKDLIEEREGLCYLFFIFILLGGIFWFYEIDGGVDGVGGGFEKSLGFYSWSRGRWDLIYVWLILKYVLFLSKV